VYVASSSCDGKSIPAKHGNLIGGYVITRLILRAPPFRNALIIARELVPRTKLSSTTTTCLFSIIS